MDRKGVRASFTVEAAVIVPFVLFLSIGVLRIGIGFYQDSVNRKQDIKLQGMNSVERFYQLQMLEELGRDVYENGG
ncbi:MAG: hypothetical protein IJF60_00800 [Agathobacter sp.]|nr:hypothetical protein [Agathobacter sp.]